MMPSPIIRSPRYSAQDLAERIRHEVEDVLSDYGERDALARRGRMFD